MKQLTTVLSLLNFRQRLKCCCEYDVRRTLFTTKPSVPDVSFDTIVYSEDDKVAKKILKDTLSDLTDAEIATIKLFANASAQEVPSGSISNLLDEHNSI